MWIHMDHRMAQQIIDDGIGHIHLYILQHRLMGQHIKASRAIEPVAGYGHADMLIRISQRSAFERQRYDPAACGTADIKGIVDAGEIVIVVMSHLGQHKGFRHVYGSVIVQGKVCGAMLHIKPQIRNGEIQHQEGIAVDVGGYHVADGNFLRQPEGFVGQRDGTNLGTGQLPDYRIHEVAQRAALDSHGDMGGYGQWHIQMTNRGIKPLLNTFLQDG